MTKETVRVTVILAAIATGVHGIYAHSYAWLVVTLFLLFLLFVAVVMERDYGK